MICSLGEVLRNIQFRNLVSEDFIVMYGDTITNMDLGEAVNTHFAKKKELKSVAMTTVMRQGGVDENIHITNSETSEILQIHHDNGDKFKLNADRIKLKKMNVEFRRDLTHCDIYICGVDVLNTFKEIQDYTSMYDFIEAMLTSDVFDEKIVAYTLQNTELAYRINTAKGYYLAHSNYICKHFYPYTLFNQAKLPKWFKPDNIPYFSSAFNKILSNSAVLSRTASVSSNSFIGNNSHLGEGVTVQKSIIGNNCTIEDNVSIKNCIILDGCTLVCAKY